MYQWLIDDPFDVESVDYLGPVTDEIAVDDFRPTGQSKFVYTFSLRDKYGLKTYSFDSFDQAFFARQHIANLIMGV